MSNLESRSFITADGMRFVSFGDSERKRDRMHINPKDSPLRFRNYESILACLVKNTIPKKLYIRNEDNYEIIDPKNLVDIRSLPAGKKNIEINKIAEKMFWSEEIIIEESNPEVISIQNVPQVVFEEVIPLVDDIDITA